MISKRSVQASLLGVCMAAFSCAGLAADNAKMTRDQYKAAKDKIEADYKSAKQACGDQKGNAKDVCEAQAKAQEKVAKSELEYDRSGKESDHMKSEQVKAEQQYEVAKTKCDDLKGGDESACKKEAKATEEKAKADLKAHQRKTASKS